MMCIMVNMMEKETHLQELLGGWDEARIAHNRLQDDACDFALVGLKDAPHGLQVIVAGCQCGSCNGHTTFIDSSTTLLRSYIFDFFGCKMLCTHSRPQSYLTPHSPRAITSQVFLF